jgi:hypothetical protein
MKSNYRSRIAALAAEVVGSPRFAPPRPPFVVWPGEGTRAEAIHAARKERRTIVYVEWSGNGEAEFIVDNVPDCVTWSTLKDCPMSIKKFHANLANGELVGPSYVEWMRPEESSYQPREDNA